MARGMPSMTALLALLAVAGYQNRDKIAEWLGGTGQGKPGAAGQGGIGGLVTQLRNSLGGANAGGMLSGGLGELVDRFKQSGQAETAESWVKTGPNRPCTPAQLEQRSAPRCWTRCRNKPDCRGTSCWRDCAASFPTPSTSTRRKGGTRPKASCRVPRA